MTKKTVVTKTDIVRGLRDVGIREGDIVGVHSSLSKFGYVEGGADAVIDALLEAVGSSGSVVFSDLLQGTSSTLKRRRRSTRSG